VGHGLQRAGIVVGWALAGKTRRFP
jgi:hypothetical protein